MRTASAATFGGCSAARPRAAAGVCPLTTRCKRLLQIYEEWPELQDAHDDERDRRLYRCLRDAAGQALRAEHGRTSVPVRIVPGW
jgi:hypothetical protein